MNVEERRDDRQLRIRIALPDLDLTRDVEIAVVGATVRIQVGRLEESTAGGVRASTSRVVRHAATLPRGTTADDVSATYADGVLEVTVPADSAGPVGVDVPVISR